MKLNNHTTRKCPICKQDYSRPPALSRKDNKIQICPECGTKEALQAMNKCIGEFFKNATAEDLEKFLSKYIKDK